MMGKCVCCGTLIARLSINGVDASEGFGKKTWKAITLNCPSCNAVLGAQIDPIAIRTDIVNLTVTEIRKVLGR